MIKNRTWFVLGIGNLIGAIGNLKGQTLTTEILIAVFCAFATGLAFGSIRIKS